MYILFTMSELRMLEKNACISNLYTTSHDLWLLCNFQSQLDETQVLEDDDVFENVYENDDQSSKQISTPKRQLNR